MLIRGNPRLLREMKKVVAFGNPLLDTTVYIMDNNILDKHNLKYDGHQELNKEEMNLLLQDISMYKQHQTAGGCAQNTMRVLQWLLNKQGEAIMFGSVGTDIEASTLKHLVENDGVKTRYIPQNLPTGRSIVLVNGQNSSRVACIAAAEHLSLTDLHSVQDFDNIIFESDIIYIEGFFLPNRIATIKYILTYCQKVGKTVIFNICGEYLCELLPEVVKYFVENVNIVFGSKVEFEALRKVIGVDSIHELTKHLIQIWHSKGNQYTKIIVITDGPNMGSFVTSHGNSADMEYFDVAKIENIKDTTGAGDAFAGGFIAGLCKEKSVSECIKIGCFAAYNIIQQTGCTLPNFIPKILQ